MFVVACWYFSYNSSVTLICFQKQVLNIFSRKDKMCLLLFTLCWLITILVYMACFILLLARYEMDFCFYCKIKQITASSNQWLFLNNALFSQLKSLQFLLRNVFDSKTIRGILILSFMQHI